MTLHWAALALIRRWQRNLLAACAIVLGAAAVVIVTMLATSSALQTAQAFDSEDSDTLRVINSDAGVWERSESSAAAWIPRGGVVGLGTFTELNTGVPATLRSAFSQTAEVNVYAASREGLATFGTRIVAGVPLPEVTVVQRDPYRMLLGTRLAKDLGIRVDDLVYFNDVLVHVDGIITDTGRRSLAATSVIIHPETAKALGLSTNLPRTVLVRASPGHAQAVEQAIEKTALVIGPETIQVIANTGPTQLRDKLLAEARSLVVVVSASIAAVATLTVLTTMVAASRERRGEIGILYALGAKPGPVAASLAGEAALLGLAGSLLGWSAGVVVSTTVAALRGWPLVFEPWLLAVVPGAVLASLLGALIPVALAARIDPNSLIRAS